MPLQARTILASLDQMLYEIQLIVYQHLGHESRNMSVTRGENLVLRRRSILYSLFLVCLEQFKELWRGLTERGSDFPQTAIEDHES